jgi:putative transposase
VLRHSGIEFASLRYNCGDLLTLRTQLKGKPAKIKYHPADLSCLYVYDPFDRRYIRVPALAQEYTQGLSLWKHRVIRQVVLEAQDRVDLEALGKAKRKIQQIVDAGRQRKRQATRSRIARWDTAGKPARQAAAELETEGKSPRTAITEPVPVPCASTSLVLLSEDEDHWEIGYAPLKHTDMLTANEKQVQDG